MVNMSRVQLLPYYYTLAFSLSPSLSLDVKNKHIVFVTLFVRTSKHHNFFCLLVKCQSLTVSARRPKTFFF